MSELTEFLLARIAVDEKRATSAAVSMHGQRHDDRWDYAGYVLGSERDATPAQDEFITEWWPARVLAECAAKRAIIEQAQDATDLDKYATDDWPEPRNLATQPYCGDVILRALAAVYKDHPGYRQEWANG